MKPSVLIWLVFLPCSGAMAQVNNRPTVTIEQPAYRSIIPAGAPVPYSVRVTDPEDGDSRYEEISSAEVMLLIKPLRDTTGLKYHQKMTEELLPGLFSLRAANCLSCHAAQTPLIGPSFAALASRYTIRDVESLARKIRSGGSGTWGDTLMPAHPDLPVQEAQELAKWIITRFSASGMDFKSGITGVFRVSASVNGGACLLLAAYRDHGSASDKVEKTGVAMQLVTMRKD